MLRGVERLASGVDDVDFTDVDGDVGVNGCVCCLSLSDLRGLTDSGSS